MGSSEKFCLKWNDFQTNISSQFSHMRTDDDFCDVTLACGGIEKIQAHKVVLAASSTFFSLLLKKNKHPHPLIYMRGMSTRELTDVVDLLYHGQVNIYQEDLDAFLKLGDELQLKGLIGSNVDNQTTQEITTDVKLPEAKKIIVLKPSYKSNQNTPSMQLSESNNKTSQPNELNTNLVNCESFEETSLALAESSGLKLNANIDDLDETINSMMEILEPGMGYACQICGKTELKFKGNMRNHNILRESTLKGLSMPAASVENHTGIGLLWQCI